MIKLLFSSVLLLTLCGAHIISSTSQKFIPLSGISLFLSLGVTEKGNVAADDEIDIGGPRKLNLTLRNSNNMFYYREVYVGGKDSPFKVAIETGSKDDGDPAKARVTVPFTLPYLCWGCTPERKYNCSASATCDMNQTIHQKLFYNTRRGFFYDTVAGYFGHEMIGLTPDFKMNSSVLWSNDFLPPRLAKIDGWMGLSSFESDNSYLDQAYEQHYIQDKVFSFYLDWNNNSQIDTKRSYLAMGYIPEDKVNNLIWIPVNTSSENSWALTYSSIKIGNKTVEEDPNIAIPDIAIDVGASFISMSRNAYEELYSQLQTLESDFNSYICNDIYLDKYPNITYKLDNMDLVIDVYTYLSFVEPKIRDDGKRFCKLIVEISERNQILGNPFLRNHFVAFSKRNQTVGIHPESKRIRFDSYVGPEELEEDQNPPKEPEEDKEEEGLPKEEDKEEEVPPKEQDNDSIPPKEEDNDNIPPKEENNDNIPSKEEDKGVPEEKKAFSYGWVCVGLLAVVLVILVVRRNQKKAENLKQALIDEEHSDVIYSKATPAL